MPKINLKCNSISKFLPNKVKSPHQHQLTIKTLEKWNWWSSQKFTIFFFLTPVEKSFCEVSCRFFGKKKSDLFAISNSKLIHGGGSREENVTETCHMFSFSSIDFQFMQKYQNSTNCPQKILHIHQHETSIRANFFCWSLQNLIFFSFIFIVSPRKVEN